MKAIALLLLVSATAAANPRPLPFTYTTDTLAPGNVEIEQFVDLDPVVGLNPTASSASSARQYYVPSAWQTEIEIGIAERLELGLYMTLVPDAGEQLVNKIVFPDVGSGLKQRVRYIFAEPNEWPIDVGVYGELTENERDIEIEAKLLLQRRFDRLRIAANLSSEYELYYSHQRDYDLNPTAGITYEVKPAFHVGLDSFLRAEYPQNPRPAMRTFGLGPELYVGPAVMTSFGKLWWAVGAYFRVTDVSHHIEPGEPYGPIYVRSMIGYNL